MKDFLMNIWNQSHSFRHGLRFLFVGIAGYIIANAPIMTEAIQKFIPADFHILAGFGIAAVIEGLRNWYKHKDDVAPVTKKAKKKK